MQKIDKSAHAAKVVALCLPSVVMSLLGPTALTRKKNSAAVVLGKRRAPMPGTARDSIIG